jgi:hypothetical protein
MATSHGFWLTNRVANPVLRRLLRTRAGSRLGRQLLVLRYIGVRTDRPHELVTQYARDGDTIWILVGRADRKVWWHNLRMPADVELWLAGEHARARAVAVDGGARPDEAAAGLTVYLRAVPRAASAVGLTGLPGATSIRQAARLVVLVRARPDALIRLRPTAPRLDVMRQGVGRGLISIRCRVYVGGSLPYAASAWRGGQPALGVALPMIFPRRAGRYAEYRHTGG